MHLKDFSTITEARQYSTTKGRMISHDMIVVFLTKNQCITSLQTATDESAKGFGAASGGIKCIGSGQLLHVQIVTRL